MAKLPVTAPDRALQRPGRAFQDLVATVERAIAGQDGVVMETNVLVRDADGDLREHDILLTHTEGLRVTKTAVECKDHGRKIGKPELEAFRSKCQDTGIHKGVMVSSSGFALSALKASRRTNVQCLELAKVASFPWVGLSVSWVRQRDFSNIDIEVFARTPVMPPFRILAASGELTNAHFQNVCQLAINDSQELSQLGREEAATIILQWAPSDGAYVIDGQDRRHEVDYFVLRPTFTVTETPQDFELHSYSGDTGKVEVATSDFDLAGFTGKLVMLRDEKGIRVMIQAGQVVPKSGTPT
jgi:hypothetical protein